MYATTIQTKTNRLMNGNFSTSTLEPWAVSAERHHTIRKDSEDEGYFIRLSPGTTLSQNTKGINRPVRASFKVRAAKVGADEFAYGACLVWMAGDNGGTPYIFDVRATSEWETRELVLELPNYSVTACTFAVSCLGPAKPTDNKQNAEQELAISSMDYTDFIFEYV